MLRMVENDAGKCLVLLVDRVIKKAHSLSGSFEFRVIPVDSRNVPIEPQNGLVYVWCMTCLSVRITSLALIGAATTSV